MKIVVLYPENKGNRIPVHLMYPLLRSNIADHAMFCGGYAAALSAVKKYPSAIVCVYGVTHRFENKELREFSDSEIDHLRQVSRQLVFFDTSPSASRFQTRLLTVCDKYLKQSLMRDAALINGLLLSSGVASGVDCLVRDKIRLSWNVGFGLYPRTVATKRLPPVLERFFGVRHCLRPWPSRPKKIVSRVKKPVLHARFSVSDKSREQLMLAARRMGHDALVGKVGRLQYNREIREVHSVLSPYGASEVCYRDFEAAQYGAVMLKPKMSHLITWPDIYQDDQFMQIETDGSDLESVFEASLRSGKNYPGNAFLAIDEAYKQIDQRVAEIFGL